MKKLNFIKIFLILLVSLVCLQNCTNSDFEDKESMSVEQIDSEFSENLQNDLVASTVDKRKALTFFEELNDGLNKKKDNWLHLSVETNTLRQEGLTNTSAKLTVLDAVTKYDELKSEVWQLLVQGELKTVLMHTSKTGYNDQGYYNGVVIYTDFEGGIWSIHEVENSEVVGVFDLEKLKTAKYGSKTGKLYPCWGITCGIFLDEVIVTPRWTGGQHPSGIGGLFTQTHWRGVNPKNQYRGFNWGNMYRFEAWKNIRVLSKGKKVDPKKELECFDKNKGGKLTIYVQQPRENTNELNAENGVGHVAIGVEQNGVKKYFGFYPPSSASNVGIGIGKTYDSEIRDNSTDLYHVSISRNVSASQMAAVINYAQNPPGKYNLNSFACADFGIKIGNLGGIPLKSTTVDYVAIPIIAEFHGRSPAQLGQEIRAMKETPELKIEKKKGNIPQKSSEKCR